jgi:hypothetical protein
MAPALWAPLLVLVFWVLLLAAGAWDILRKK